ncbi:uncharacterized protein LOC129777230 [Toxorhynchites rutilus septentrionalis]|uniref:uncharacterized protein LOC129777230 n=1 Tax=Toxorhynchites rutilus septentrionalis TaxID=329112 RepID=UPI00247A60C2|nr:uncharacterized protein LOC129777230 [Toxorhynchites rutilus septentrionalis]
MEKSFLNVAHVYSRKAEKFAKQSRYDDAAESHLIAATNLEEAIRMAPNSPVALESLQLQRKYHLKQVDFMRHKKQQHERYLEALEYQKRRNPEYFAQQMEKIDNYNDLQLAIHRNLDNADSLLETLTKTRTAEATESDRKGSIVDELISLNHSLHVLFQRMAHNLDECTTENETLKEKLSEYEKEKQNCFSGKDKGGGSFETGRDALEAIDYHTEELPPLAPLELPTFDLPGFEEQ